jgi:hypothetical protein
MTQHAEWRTCSALKAAAAARALPALADRAREELWRNERFAEALLSTDVGASQPARGALLKPQRGQFR